jgi:hypothetical protein
MKIFRHKSKNNMSEDTTTTLTPRQFLERTGARSWTEIHWTQRVPNLAQWLKERRLTAYFVGFPGKGGAIVPFALWCVKQ